MNSTIATFMAIDTAAEDSAMEYSMLGGPGSATARRGIYWKNVITWGATARRCYPDAQVVVVTNDSRDSELDGASLDQTLDELEIARMIVPFEVFKPPPGRVQRYINVHYRFDALRALVNAPGLEDASFFVTDSDVVWARRVDDLDAVLPTGGLFLHAPHPVLNPAVHHPHNLSRAEMGEVFRRVDPAYPEPYPTWYGMDLVGGGRTPLQQLMVEWERTWLHLLEYTAVQPLYFPNGNNMMENDEMIGSYILNRKQFPIKSPDGFFMRLFTLEYSQGRNPVDTSGVIWHVPQEKQRGLRLLYDQVMDRQSAFWATPIQEFASYLGPYLGVPRRRFDISYTPRQQLERHARMVGRGIRRWNTHRKLKRELKQ